VFLSVCGPLPNKARWTWQLSLR